MFTQGSQKRWEILQDIERHVRHFTLKTDYTEYDTVGIDHIIDVVNDKYPSESPVDAIIENAFFPNGRWEIPEGVDAIV